MQRIATPEVMKGPVSFWNAVRYFYKQPEVGLVAVRQLFDAEQVAAIQDASRSSSAVMARLNMPNVLNTRAMLNEGLMTRGIMPTTLEAMNRTFWDPEADFDLSMDDWILTRFGRGKEAHTDLTSDSRRPIGVSVSVSIGRCTFAAALPPVEMRTKAGATEDDAYYDWHYGAVKNTDVLHNAELEAGDAVFWLQPGVHEALTDDPNRFAAIYLTYTQQ